MTVASILKHKGSEIAHVAPADSIAAVSALLARRRIGAVLVLDTAGQLLGIVSERDIVRVLARQGAATLEMTAAQLMTSSLVTVTPATSVAEAMTLMTASRVRHLPVLQDGALAGLVSIGDIVKTRIEQQAHEVDSLRAYVSGGA